MLPSWNPRTWNIGCAGILAATVLVDGVIVYLAWRLL
jgi:hypothetical protein